MTEKEAAEQTIVFWISSAQEALESARSELAAGRRRFAINRAYYACFYAASAVLLQQGRTFVKHSGLRAALHEHLVRSGRLERPWGGILRHDVPQPTPGRLWRGSGFRERNR